MKQSDPIISLALGRILRIASRPTQPGDIEEYERCRSIILDATERPRKAEPNPPLPGWNFGSGSTGRVE